MRTQIKLAIASLLIFVPVLGTSGNQDAKNTNSEQTVYICTGPKAYTYHKSSDCSGLNRCSGSVISVSLSKAKQMGRRPCKKCY